MKSDTDKEHMIRVRAVHSALKTGVCYEVTLLFDEDSFDDHFCKCGSGARAFPCAHISAMLTSLSWRQGAKPTARDKRSGKEF